MTYVLIPGAGGSAWYWHLVERDLRARGQDVVAVELPADDPAAGLSEYADVVVAAADGRDRIIVVAQSMGGFTAPMVCGRLPVERLALVNAMIPLPGETAGEWWAATGQAEAKAADEAAHGRAGGFEVYKDFLHDIPADLIAQSGAHEKAQSDGPFPTACAIDAWPDVSTRVIVGRDDRFFPAAFQRRIARERLGIDVVEVPGGHLVALSYPAELTAALEAFRRDGS
jgi:pimeloyl-ACP methyl ester carboxylesterase